MDRIVLLLLFVSSGVANALPGEKCLKHMTQDTKLTAEELTTKMVICGYGATINENALWTNHKLGHILQAEISAAKDHCILFNKQIKEYMKLEVCQ